MSAMYQGRAGVAAIRPTLLGLHFFRSPERRVASRRSGELGEFVVVLGGVYAATEHGPGGWERMVKAQAGDVVYWPANRDRTEENDPARPTECIAIYFRWPGAPAGLVPMVRDEGNLIRLLALRLLALKEAPGSEPTPLWHAYLAALVAEYMRLSKGREDPRVARVAEYVERHLREPFGLGDLASAVGLNRFYFGRWFRALTGLTPMEFVRRKRVEHAVGMFASPPRYTVAQVAAQVGLPDPVCLRRLLKRYTGIGARAIVRMARSRGSEPFRWRVDGSSGAVKVAR